MSYKRKNKYHYREEKKQHIIFSSDPLSLQSASAVDIENEDALKGILREANKLEESCEEQQKRELVLGELDEICQEWVRSSARKQKYPEEFVSKSCTRLFAYGSYKLGVHSSGDDVDLLCVGPRYLTREHFFDELGEMLASNPCVRDFVPVRAAYVPVMTFEYNGVDIDMVYAQLQIDLIDYSWDINDDRNLRNLDGPSVLSLNGVRLATKTLELVPNKAAFKLSLRAIRHWAKSRAIYSNKLGYLGGVSWAILTARVCQLYPNANASMVVQNFFLFYHMWSFGSPMRAILLSDIINHDDIQTSTKVWDPNDHNTKQEMMHIITPAFPAMNSTHNVSISTFELIKKEIARTFHLLSRAEKTVSVAKWEKVFEANSFFLDHKNYIFIKACAPKKYLKEWSSTIESRIRSLVTSLEHDHIFGCKVTPYCRKIYCYCKRKEIEAHTHKDVLEQLEKKRKKLLKKKKQRLRLQKKLRLEQKKRDEENKKLNEIRERLRKEREMEKEQKKQKQEKQEKQEKDEKLIKIEKDEKVVIKKENDEEQTNQNDDNNTNNDGDIDIDIDEKKKIKTDNNDNHHHNNDNADDDDDDVVLISNIVEEVAVNEDDDKTKNHALQLPVINKKKKKSKSKSNTPSISAATFSNVGRPKSNPTKNPYIYIAPDLQRKFANRGRRYRGNYGPSRYRNNHRFGSFNRSYSVNNSVTTSPSPSVTADKSKENKKDDNNKDKTENKEDDNNSSKGDSVPSQQKTPSLPPNPYNVTSSKPNEISCCKIIDSSKLTDIAEKLDYECVAFVIGLNTIKQSTTLPDGTSQAIPQRFNFTRHISVFLNYLQIKHSSNHRHVLIQLMKCYKLPHFIFPKFGYKRPNKAFFDEHQKTLTINHELWRSKSCLATFQPDLQNKIKSPSPNSLSQTPQQSPSKTPKFDADDVLMNDNKIDIDGNNMPGLGLPPTQQNDVNNESNTKTLSMTDNNDNNNNGVDSNQISASLNNLKRKANEMDQTSSDDTISPPANKKRRLDSPHSPALSASSQKSNSLTPQIIDIKDITPREPQKKLVKVKFNQVDFNKKYDSSLTWDYALKLYKYSLENKPWNECNFVLSSSATHIRNTSPDKKWRKKFEKIIKDKKYKWNGVKFAEPLTAILMEDLAHDVAYNYIKHKTDKKKKKTQIKRNNHH